METFDDYDDFVLQTLVDDEGVKDINYLTIALCGEVGEFANNIKKMIRDGDVSKDDLVEELGDALWYLTAIAQKLDSSLEEVANLNQDKVLPRFVSGRYG